MTHTRLILIFTPSTLRYNASHGLFYTYMVWRRFWAGWTTYITEIGFAVKRSLILFFLSFLLYLYSVFSVRVRWVSYPVGLREGSKFKAYF
jgi:hypothetical protein